MTINIRKHQYNVTNAQPEDEKEATQQKVREAEVALKQSKEKNYYKILGVPRTATAKEIKKAYRDLALKWYVSCVNGWCLSLSSSMSSLVLPSFRSH